MKRSFQLFLWYNCVAVICVIVFSSLCTEVIGSFSEINNSTFYGIIQLNVSDDTSHILPGYVCGDCE